MRAKPSRSSIGAGLVLAVALGRAAPGCIPSSFVCEGDESCAGLSEGQCEADGHCSIPDPDCPGGRRYAAHSGEISGHCVGEDEGTGTGTDTSTAGETGGPSTSADDTTSASTTTTVGTDTEGPTVDTCAGQPGQPGQLGQPIMDEPFSMLPIDPDRWNVFNDAGIAINVLDGELHLSAVDAMVAYTDLGSAFPLPASGSAGVELTAVPPPDVTAEAYLVLAELEVAYGVRVQGGQLALFYDDGFDDLTLKSVPHDPTAHRWLRLVFDASTDLLAWEAAPAAGPWERLHETELEPGFDVDEATLYFGAGVWSGPFTIEPLAAFGHAFVCSSE